VSRFKWYRFWDDPANDPPIWLVLAYILTPLAVVGAVAAAVIWWAIR
jgi:hypothetical protein